MAGKYKPNKSRSSELPRAGVPSLLPRIPRTETLVLAAAFVLTFGGKLVILIRQRPQFVLSGFIHAVLPDVLFFLLLALFIRAFFVVRPCRLAARVGLCAAGGAFLWSLCDVCWLVHSGVQLQPGIVFIFLRDVRELAPVVGSYLWGSPALFLPLFVLLAAAVWIFVRRFINPPSINSMRREHMRLASAKLLVLVILMALGLVFESSVRPGFAGEVLGFSSHWHAIVYSAVGWRREGNGQVKTRNVPRAGEREVIEPADRQDLPHVVLVMLESVSYSMTSLHDPNLQTTPYLAELARGGVEFAQTHVPVSHTTKAYWATLTGSSPVIEADYVEAVPVAAPYEGLLSILKRVGYKGAFFEMSKGSFECGPGLFKNLAFDWAWFRENLGDEGAHLGYLSGDDCRMIEPAADWLEAQGGPALLAMITSVSHDPYDVPMWFDGPEEEPEDKYLQSLRYTDYFLKQLCHALKERGLDKNTVLCIVGDHGTSFRSNTGFARWNPYEEVIRVPWVIRWPGRLAGGVRNDWPCSQLDVTPTLLSVLGFGIERAGFEGRNALVPSDTNRRLYFSSWYSDSPIGFREGRRKVVYWPYLDKVFEYDLIEDPGEDGPLRVPPPYCDALKEEILAWQGTSQIAIDSRRYTDDMLYSHWRTISSGRKAWAYYVP
jgi:glucan phosphoethanolaminetransferase (alkaline phosphatase superfamily)